MPRQPSEKPGLQAERTQLSWERTAFSFLGAGALALLGRDGPLSIGQSVLPVVGAALALLAAWMGRRRARSIRTTPRIEVLVVGWATAGFAALIVAFAVL
jgi:putative membrane protein